MMVATGKYLNPLTRISKVNHMFSKGHIERCGFVCYYPTIKQTDQYMLIYFKIFRAYLNLIGSKFH